MSRFIRVITSRGDERDVSLDVCAGASPSTNSSPNARRLKDSAAVATTFTSAYGRSSSFTPSIAFTFQICCHAAAITLIPFAGFENLLERRFEEAIEVFLAAQAEQGASASISSALAASYRALGFQTLADQVRRSVRSVRGNQWMFRAGHTDDYPLRLRPELLDGDPVFPILREATPVRMDLTHSGWSDIFFLGMDFPEGARVINVSIDLAVRAASQPLCASPASSRSVVPRD